MTLATGITENSAVVAPSEVACAEGEGAEAASSDEDAAYMPTCSALLLATDWMVEAFGRDELVAVVLPVALPQRPAW